MPEPIVTSNEESLRSDLRELVRKTVARLYPARSVISHTVILPVGFSLYRLQNAARRFARVCSVAADCFFMLPLL